MSLDNFYQYFSDNISFKRLSSVQFINALDFNIFGLE